jgi:Lrp/AsnC family transcriptional regulator
MNSLDKFDCAILAALQADATLSISGLSEKVGLSSTPCWKRVKRLEEEGYIESRVSIVNRNKVGLPVTVFVSVRTNRARRKMAGALRRRRGRPARSARIPPHERRRRLPAEGRHHRHRGYDRFYKKLIKTAHLSGVSSAFSMEQIKCTTALPLELISHGLPA